MNSVRRFGTILFLAGIIIILQMIWNLMDYPGQPAVALAQVSSPTPTYDPLAAPPLPENPTIWEHGRYLYWYYCMPCHGDQGQGLTDEWRAVWVEDHQNCWEIGCHGGHRQDEGFLIPTYVPPVVHPIVMGHFQTTESLYDYLRLTHPPQSPGELTDNEYWAITLYTFAINGISIPESTPMPTSAKADIEILSGTANPESSESLQGTGTQKKPAVQVVAVVILMGTLLITGLIMALKFGTGMKPGKERTSRD